MLPFIDLKHQYGLIKDDVQKRIDRVLESGRFILGGEVTELQERLAEYAGSKHCICCSSGTDALLMALMALEIGPGDAVVTTPFTFFATVETIMLVGATPVFADIDPATYDIDPKKVEEAIERTEKEGRLKVKAIAPVDLFGLCADYDALLPIAEKHGLAVIQDACQAFGAVAPSGKKAPSIGTIGCTSFFPAKPLGCYGDGGAVFTDDDDLFAKLDSILVHGRAANDKYDNARLGLNARCDTIQAAILLSKLEIFPGEVELRQKVAARYRANLEGVVSLQKIPEGNLSVYAQFCPRSPKFAEIQAALKAQDVPTARYYPIPMHLLGATKSLGGKVGDMPNAEAAASDIFALPMHPYLDDATIDRICETIAATVKNA